MEPNLRFFLENQNTIENFRTEEEIITFFKTNKIFIDKNFLNKLRLKYNNINNSTKLNSSQLESVAGGGPTRHGGIKRLHSESSSPETHLLPNPGNGTQSAPGSPVHNIFNDRNQRILVSPISLEEIIPQPAAQRRRVDEPEVNSSSQPSTPENQGRSIASPPLLGQNGKDVSSTLNRKAGDQGVHRNFDMIISSTPLHKGQESFESEVRLPRKTVSNRDIFDSSNPQATPLRGPSTPNQFINRIVPGAPIHGSNNNRTTPPTTPMPQPTDCLFPDSNVTPAGTPLSAGWTNRFIGENALKNVANNQTLGRRLEEVEREDQRLQSPPTDHEIHSPTTNSSAASSSPEVQSGSNSSSQAASPLTAAAVANFMQENRENIDPTLPEDVVLSQPAQLNTDAAYVFQPMQPSEAVMSILPENIDESIDVNQSFEATHDDQTDYRYLEGIELRTVRDENGNLTSIKPDGAPLTDREKCILQELMSGRNTLDPKTGRLTGKMDKTFMPQLCGC